jgi:curli biogenesis system outer membrane secretion channel CsgG
MLLGSILLLSLSLVQSPGPATQEGDKATEAKSASTVDAGLGEKLLKVKRIYVESFGDDTASKQIQAMLINSLSDTKRFMVTENKEKADAVMKGSTLEATSQELHSSSELTVAGRSAIGNAEKSTETINEARLAVRLVSNDGDVIWTTTQESKGAKFKGAGADVADKVAKQLLRDIEKFGKPQSGPK